MYVKILAGLLIVSLPAMVVGGTVWTILAWALVGWAKWLLAFGGLVVGTLLSFALYWVLWPRPSFDESDDDSGH